MNRIIAVLAIGFLVSFQALAQAPGTANGEWHYLGGDSAHTRYSPADQIDAARALHGPLQFRQVIRNFERRRSRIVVVPAGNNRQQERDILRAVPNRGNAVERGGKSDQPVA